MSKDIAPSGSQNSRESLRKLLGGVNEEGINQINKSNKLEVAKDESSDIDFINFMSEGSRYEDLGSQLKATRKNLELSSNNKDHSEITEEGYIVEHENVTEDKENIISSFTEKRNEQLINEATSKLLEIATFSDPENDRILMQSFVELVIKQPKISHYNSFVELVRETTNLKPSNYEKIMDIIQNKKTISPLI